MRAVVNGASTVFMVIQLFQENTLQYLGCATLYKRLYYILCMYEVSSLTENISLVQCSNCNFGRTNAIYFKAKSTLGFLLGFLQMTFWYFHCILTKLSFFSLCKNILEEGKYLNFNVCKLIIPAQVFYIFPILFTIFVL